MAVDNKDYIHIHSQLVDERIICIVMHICYIVDLLKASAAIIVRMHRTHEMLRLVVSLLFLLQNAIVTAHSICWLL